MFFHRAAHPSADTTAVVASAAGTRTLLYSLVILIVTGGIQIIIVYVSGSLALFADTLHNFSDALTSIPLWIAFRLALLSPTRRFTLGYGRFEDLAGVLILLIILFSAGVCTYESIMRLLYPQPITHLGWVVLAAIVGFLGNEWVARIRLKTGREMNSAALIADGQHARIDAWTSLAVLGSSIGVILGFPIIDTIVGLGMSAMILYIVWESGKSILLQLLDGVDPKVVDQILRILSEYHISPKAVHDVRVRWVGHVMQAELHIHFPPNEPIGEIPKLQHRLLHRFQEDLPSMKSLSIVAI